MPTQSQTFRFERLDKIGSADAEEDRDFLQACFLDTGALRVLQDCGDPRRIVVGRTGSGKTALLLMLAGTEPQAIDIKPESLALGHISNSTVLPFFASVGVNLDIFYKLLWRHVLAIELLKRHYDYQGADAPRTLFSTLRQIFRNEKQKRAIDYLEKWGDKFWKEPEDRIKDVTTKLEEELKAEAKAALPGALSFSIAAAHHLTEEQKREVAQRAQAVVNRVQIRELSEILDLVNDILSSDRQKRYYVTIDRLDEGWIDDYYRFKLIRALIETVRDFRKVEQAKIVIALRLDLIERVFRLTRDSGFQEEKYRSLYLDVEWTPEQLIQLIDKRISYLVKRRYTGKRIALKDLFPKAVNGVRTSDFLIQRTMLRPRDVIDFVNYCILSASHRSSFTADIIRQAEGEYSRARLKALGDEWAGDYPSLIDGAMILKGFSSTFQLDILTDDLCEEFCLNYVIERLGKPEMDDIITKSAQAVVECVLAATSFKKTLMSVFYRVGLIGLKLERHDKVNWATSGRTGVSDAEISESVSVAIHPAFWRVFGIKTQKR
jgi:energy-coupling factor transporter ATP-binding protein EcfA2